MDLARLWCVLALAGVVTLTSPSTLHAWGYTGHWLIIQGAVDNLPDEMFDDGSGNGFDAWRDEIADFAGHPDFMRNFDYGERNRHTLCLDVDLEEYPPPFTTIPRDQAAYVDKFGRGCGVVPWEGVRDHMEGLTQAFRTRNWYAARRAAADLAHYVADSAQPFHTTVNWNGQRTGNDGIHARLEEDFVDRFIGVEDLVTRRSSPPLPDSIRHVSGPVEFTFEELIGAHALLGPILAADTVARGLDPSFGDGYYNSLHSQVGDATVGQINDAAQRVADLWYTAWVNAGAPDFSPDPVVLSAPSIHSVVDGILDEFTTDGVLQTNITDHGDNLNEINQVQMAHDSGNLLLGMSGNLGSGHVVVILLDTIGGGTNPLQIPDEVDGLSALDGLDLSPDFRPDFALAIANANAVMSVRLIDLKQQSARLLGVDEGDSVSLFPGGRLSCNNSNTDGVRDRTGGSVIRADIVRTGLEISIPMKLLDIGPLGDGEVGVVALLLESDGESQITNQTLPGFPLGEFEPSHGASRCSVSGVGSAQFVIDGMADQPDLCGLSLQ